MSVKSTVIAWSLSIAVAFSAILPAQAIMPRASQAEIGLEVVEDVRHRRWRKRRGAIIGAVIGGAIIGGAIARHRRHRHYGDYHYRNRYYGGYRRHYRYRPYRAYRVRPARGGRHVAWCHGRYRSYRAYDNTYQPYHGGRRICVSPYY